MNRVFVYGILKHRYENAREAFVKGYRLVDKGWFPAAIPHESCSIKGELILVDKATIAEFDMIEGHPTFYLRSEVDVEVDGETVKAEMYVINSDEWETPSRQTAHLTIGDVGEPYNVMHEYEPHH